MQKLFLDFEFTGLHKATTPISMAIASEKGNFFYAEFTDYDKSQINPWLEENVIKHLFLKDPVHTVLLQDNLHNEFVKGDKQTVADFLRVWLVQFGAPDGGLQVWCDVGHYDKILFDSLFGTAFDIPKSIHYIFQDIATLLFCADVDPDINRSQFIIHNLRENEKRPSCEINGIELIGKHNALPDAMLTYSCYLVAYEKLKMPLYIAQARAEIAEQDHERSTDIEKELYSLRKLNKLHARDMNSLQEENERYRKEIAKTNGLEHPPRLEPPKAPAILARVDFKMNGINCSEVIDALEEKDEQKLKVLVKKILQKKHRDQVSEIKYTPITPAHKN